MKLGEAWPRASQMGHVPWCGGTWLKGVVSEGRLAETSPMSPSEEKQMIPQMKAVRGSPFSFVSPNGLI